MNLMRKSILALLIVGFTNFNCFAIQGRQSEVSSAEYAVYSAVLAQSYARARITLFVIEDHTENTSVHYEDDMAGYFRYVKKHIPSLSQAAINNYRKKDRESQPLTRLFKFKIKYALISRTKFEGFAGPGGMMEISKDGWEKFYQEYPGALGLLSLSRVGFDPKKKQALVYVSDMRGHPSGRSWGAGSYVLLIEKNGAWRVRGHVAVLVS
jgi:hypothetical protein